MLKQLYYFFVWMRPKQWIKNFLLFVPLFFSGQLFDMNLLLQVIIWFILFSIFAGSIYILNDIKDIKLDRMHPNKKNRPIASWKLNKWFAMFFSIILILTVLYFVYKLFGIAVLILFKIYLINILLYIFWWKNIVILDVFFIAIWFVIRWLLWIFIIGVPISIWFLLLIFFWALILWFLKRYQEVKLWIISRKNIKMYNEEFLKQIISMLTTLIIMAYSFYTFNSTQPKLFVITIPFVLFGIIRYIYNIFYLEKYKEGIEDIIISDKFIMVDILIYWIIAFLIIYFQPVSSYLEKFFA